jgi:hypothetical protein
MAKGTGTLVEVVAEAAEVAEVDVADPVDGVDAVVIHVMREVVFEDKIVMKMAEGSRGVSCSNFCVILCGPVESSLQSDRMSVYVHICRIYHS